MVSVWLEAWKKRPPHCAKNAPSRMLTRFSKLQECQCSIPWAGASGVIFGSMFLGGVKGLSPIYTLDCSNFTRIFRGSLEAIKTRGKAAVGDKTMVDALEPAVIAMENAQQEDLISLLNIAANAAAEGVENTKKYMAKFGRAKSLMERAIGYQDAGATSVSIIFTAMHDYLLTL